MKLPEIARFYPQGHRSLDADQLRLHSDSVMNWQRIFMDKGVSRQYIETADGYWLNPDPSWPPQANLSDLARTETLLLPIVDTD